MKLTISFPVGAEGVRRAQQRVRGAPEGRAARRLYPGEGGEAGPEDWLPLRGRVGKNPGLKKKPSPVVFFCFFFVFFLVYLPRRESF